MRPAVPLLPHRAGLVGPVLIGMVLGLLALVSITHIGIGSRYIPPGKVLTALFAYNGADFDHRIIVHLRLLRLLAGIFAGAALGVAGVILQSIVRNPLGEPHILGLNAGASLAVVIGMVTGIPWLGSALGRPLVAMLGATILFSLVLGISCAGRGGPTPLKVTLCGVALSALAASLTSTLLLLDEQALLGLRLWLAGDLSGLGYQSVLTSGLFVAVGLLAGFVLSPRLNVMELGDIAAAGLGINLMRTRAAGLVIAALLCGAAVSIAGPIGFIGLVVPHLLRRFAGGDIRILAPGAAAAGACLLLGADMLARVVLAPQELATGVMTAIIGAPVFIVIAARFFR